MIRFHSDEGTEFNNSQVKEMLRKIGADQTFSNPYTPQQNGIAERSNQTLLNLTRTTLISTNLPQRLWAECLAFCTEILNATTLNKETGKSAYELMHNKKPYLGKIHPFGSPCFIRNLKGKNKFDARSNPGILVGLCDNGMGYRVWLKGTNIVKRSKDVTFQNKSPFSSIKETEVEKSTSPLKSSITQIGRTAQAEPESTGNEKTERGIDDESTKEEKAKATKLFTENEQPGMSYEPVKDAEQSNESPEGDRHESDSELTANIKHRMTLRDRSKIKKPQIYESYVALKHNDITTPETLQDALNSPYKKQWLEAVEAEIKSLKDLNVWSLIDCPKHSKPIGSKWIFKVKRNEQGEVDRFKARLVLKGYSQRPGIDYNQLFSPVARFDTVRTVLSIAATEKLVLYQGDVETAFLYSPISEFITMYQPEGFDDGTSKVCKLNKALYGLKQAPRAFHLKLKELLLQLNLKQGKADPCVFYKDSPERLIMCIYVDDVIIAGSNEQIIKEALNALQKELKLKYKPLNYFLGLQIKVNPDNSIQIHQQKYALEILDKFGMIDCKPAATPADTNLYLRNDKDDSVEQYPYRELIGSLMYLAIGTRPDIAFAVGYLSRFLDKYTNKHWSAAHRILRYIKATSNYGIRYESISKLHLQVFSDSDFAGEPETRKSTSGQLIKINGGAVVWASSKQHSVALSSTEAEFVAASETCKSAIWLKQLLSELQFKVTPTISVDNQSAIKLIQNPQFHKRTKHIDVRYQFIREQYELGNININYIPTNLQESDILTKPLSKTTFQNLRKLIGITEQS